MCPMKSEHLCISANVHNYIYYTKQNKINKYINSFAHDFRHFASVCMLRNFKQSSSEVASDSFHHISVSHSEGHEPVHKIVLRPKFKVAATFSHSRKASAIIQMVLWIIAHANIHSGMRSTAHGTMYTWLHIHGYFIRSNGVK